MISMTVIAIIHISNAFNVDKYPFFLFLIILGGLKSHERKKKGKKWLYNLILTVLNYLGSGHNLSDGGAEFFLASKKIDPPKSRQKKFDPPP